MTNDDFDPDFRGKFLQTIVDTYCPEIYLDEGTILIMQAESFRVFFQLSERYVYYKCRSNGPMSAIPGSVISVDVEVLDKTFILAQRVRIPEQYEVEWYNLQSTV